MLATKVCFCCATGSSPVGRMDARDVASRQVGLGDANLVTVSSVLAPGIKDVTSLVLEAALRPGDSVECVNGVTESKEPGMVVSAALAWIIPDDPRLPGYIAEVYGTPGIDPALAVQRAQEQAMQIMARKLGLKDYHARAGWQGRGEYRLGDVPVTLNFLVAATTVNRDGDDTCALVAAVLLP